MKAIILAAGVGSRLQPITNKKPKCMVMVSGKSILEHQVQGYLRAGVEDKSIYVVTGYKSEMIEQFIAENYPAVNLIRNLEYESTNNMYSLWIALQAFDISTERALLISNGDCVYDPSVIRKLVEDDRPNLIMCEVGSFNEESMKITVDNKRINNISKLITKKEAYGLSIDLYKLGGTAVSRMKKIIDDYILTRKARNLWTEVALKDLLSYELFEPSDLDGVRWVEIDNFEDLHLADRIFSSLDIQSKKCWIVDLDGTVYLGNQAVQGTVDFIKRNIKRRDFYFLTNNTSKLPSDYVEKLRGFGIQVKERMILSPVFPLLNYLKTNNLCSVYFVSNGRFVEYVKQHFPSVTITSQVDKCEALIVAYDTEITYEKLATAAILLQNNPKLLYLSTHGDMVCPTENGYIPDIGCTILTLEKTTGRRPDVVFGKPNIILLENLLRKYDPNEIIIVGDRLYTDKKLADSIKTDFVCVLSGETKREEIEMLKQANFPSLVVRSLGELANYL